MEKGEIQAALGALLTVILIILTPVFSGSHILILGLILFFGFILCGGLFAYSLSVTKVKWARITSKAFLLLPLFAIICWIAVRVISGKEKFIALITLDGGFLFFVVALFSLLIFWIDNTKHVFLKIITWIVGLFIYFVIGVLGIILYNPPRS